MLIILLNEPWYIIVFYIPAIMDVKTDIQHMDELLKEYERLTEFMPQFEEWCTRFELAIEQNIFQDSVQRSRHWTEQFMSCLDTLNMEFHKYFQSVPYQHPWIQKNEMLILWYFSETSRMYQMALSTNSKAVSWIKVQKLNRWWGL